MIRTFSISLLVSMLMASCVGHLPYPVEPLDPGQREAIGAIEDDVIVDAGRSPRIYKVSPMGGANMGAGGFQVFQGTSDLTGNWSPSADGDMLAVPLTVQAGERFERIHGSVYGNSGITIDLALFAQGSAFEIGSGFSLGHTISTPTNTLQTLSLAAIEGQPLDVTPAPGSYWLRYRAHRIRSAEGNLLVGPITVVMSTALAVLN